MNIIIEEFFTSSFAVQFELVHEVLIRLIKFLIQRLETGHRKNGYKLRQLVSRGEEIMMLKRHENFKECSSLRLYASGTVSDTLQYVLGPRCLIVDFQPHSLLFLLQFIPRQSQWPGCSVTSPSLLPLQSLCLPLAYNTLRQLIAWAAPSLFKSLHQLSNSYPQSAAHYPVLFSL